MASPDCPPVDCLPPDEAIQRFLKSFKNPSRILVAISGGSDSTGLLVALQEALVDHPGFSLCAATVDHGLRPESADEARAVADLCATLNIPHRILLWEGDKPQQGIMAAAREARYALLSDAARDLRADVIVTGHTHGDQQETIAMRTGRRGASGIGLAGMADGVLFDGSIWILRPFLVCRRDDIRVYLVDRGVVWADDPSNDDLKYERVRVRKSLQGAGDAAEHASGDARQRLAAAAAQWAERYVTVHRQVVCHLAPEGLPAEAQMFAYALGHLAAVVGGVAFSPGRETMQRVLAFVAAGRPGRITAGRVVFDLRRDGLYLVREGRNLPVRDLAEDEDGIWDGRFKVVNRTKAAVRVGSFPRAGHAAAFALLPKSVAARAMAALPEMVDACGSDLPDAVRAEVDIEPFLAPFDRFLPKFDLEFADSLAELFGRKAFCSYPLGIIDGKRI